MIHVRQDLARGRRWLHQHRQELGLLSILAIALVLRLWGVGFGLPNLYHPDEDAVLMPAIQIIRSGNLEPARMEYGTLHIYVLAALSAAVFLISSRGGSITETSQLALFERGSYPAVYAHPEYFLAARVLSALMGTMIVLLIYMLARRLGNKRQALIAAGLAAFLPRLITHAHFATTDTPLVFWVTLSFYLLVRAYDNWREDDWRAYAGAGIVCGLAASTKYNGVILIAPLLLVPLLRVRTWDELLRFRVAAGPLGMLAGFLSGTPYAILKLPVFLRWFGYSLRLYNAPRELALPSWLWHLRFHLTSVHAHVFILGIIGGLGSFLLWRKRGLILSSFVILLWAGILSQTNQQARMWLPSAPAIIIWAALNLDLVARWLQRRIDGRWRSVAAPALLLMAVTPLAVAAIQLDLRFQQEEVRTLTQKWVENNVPAGTHLAVDYFAPNLDPANWQVTKTFRLYDHDLAWYQERGITMLVMSEPITDPENLVGAAEEKYRALIDNVCLVETLFGPFLSHPGMNYWVYQMPPCP